MVKKIITLNTKGGCGKSTISHFILPYYFAKGKETKDGFKIDRDQNLSIFELEATNKNRSSQYRESVVSYIYDKLENPNKTKELLEDIGFDDDSFAIFDVGGGRDAIEAVRKFSIASGGLEDYLFVLPFTLSEDSFSGALDMYDRIKKEDGDVKALFVINKMPYRYDAGEMPYKEFLDDEDISYEIEKSGLDIVKSLKERDVKFTYIPEMPESLPSGLFSREGCCIDICKEFINGKSGSEQRKELKQKIKSSNLSSKEQKEKYVAEMHKLSQNADLYRMLGYCKPFFEAISEVSGVQKNEK